MFDTGIRIQSHCHQDDAYHLLQLSQGCNLFVTLDCSQSPIDVSMRYRCASISDKYAWTILETLVHLFKYLVQNPNSSMSGLSFLGEHASSLIAQWNDSKLLKRPKTCIHTLILDQCQKQPNAEAVCAWDGSMTYAKLDRLSGLLQLQLMSSGVRSETIVPLLFEKSMWTIVAILGVLRAGGAFTLLDPSQPNLRLVDICTACQVKVMVASESLYQRARTFSQTVVSLPSGLRAEGIPPLDAAGTQPADAENAAYIAFTSGSTGKPKTIVIEHQSFCANALAHNEVQNLNRHVRAFQFASYGFDSSILEMLMTLIAGGCVCVPSDTQRVDELASTINKLRANWLELTPSVARFLTPELVPNVRSLVLVGEPLSQENIAAWAGKVQLINAYGPAECSVVTTIQPSVKASDPLNIGQSRSGHCWIANPHDPDQLQPIGAAGELLISGPLVGRGYLNYTDQRAYIQAPSWASRFGLSPGERFYRTGDIAYYNIDDGTLRYLGRKDRQIKLNGQRIELQEVEHHAQQFRGGTVAAVDVVTTEGSQSGAVLTLFVAHGAQALSSSQDQGDLLAPADEGARALWKEMQEWLTERLPSYMVPKKFVPMYRFPLTSTGKLDRKMLLALAYQSVAPDSVGLLPPTPKEEQLVTCEVEDTLRSLFSEVLGVPKSHIGADDKFFSLGGTSLRAIELVACARSKNIAITATDVISLQTSAELARSAARCDELPIIPAFGLLGEERCLAVAKVQCQIEEEGIEDMYPCTPLQASMMSLSIKMPGSLVGIFAFTLQDSIDLDRFKFAWDQVISANPILRTRIVESENELLQVVTTGKIPWADSYPVGDCSAMALGTPLLRLALVNRGSQAQKPLFVIKMHHAIFDAWSYLQILEEVEMVYGGDSLLPRPSFNRVIDYISNIDYQAAQNFWAREFADCEPDTFPRLASKASVSRLPQSQSRHVPLKTPDQDWALASKIQLAWAILVSSHTSTNDVVFGLTVSGRTAPIQGIDRITGPTIATVPFRVQLQPDQSLQETLIQLHDHELSLVPFEHTGLLCIGDSSPEAAAACGFQNLLTIRLRAAERPSAIMTDVPENEDEEQKFNTYPLSMIVQLRVDTLQLKAFFDSSVLSTQRIQIILEQFASVLERILRQPQARIRDLMAHFAPDKDRLAAWNQRRSRTRQAFVHNIIEDYCTKQPESEAVCAWDGSFMYHELSRLARSIASHLRTEGSAPETVIGICMERSKWFPVAMLGVLMSGAAIVLLEPNFPVQRLQSICRDVNVQILISTPELRDKCTKVVGNIITLSDETVVDFAPDAYQPSSLDLQNAAYVAFTSGSTGVPKGVIIEHGMLYLAVRGHTELGSLSLGTRGLSFSSLAFDMSIFEVIYVLASGGCICIPSESQRMNNLAGAMMEMRVNWAILTPTVARTLTPSEVPSLKALVMGGEPVSESDIATWAPQVQLHNAYGPAECSMLTTAVHLTIGCDPSNIGYPSNASCWIVDPDNHHKLQPVGSIGELIIAGPIVGRGYVNRPKETEAAFIHSPAWQVDFPFIHGQPFYKTGDLAFHNADGSISLVGRKDSQVKLHGQRIELHEIERCADTCQSGTVSIAALVNFKEFNGPRIVLFTCAAKAVNASVRGKASRQSPTCPFVPASDRDLNHIQRLKEHLSQTLPHFMVPSLLIPLLYLPLSPSGKADRRELRQQAEGMGRAQLEEYLGNVVPKRQPTSTEEIFVRRAFASVLSVGEDTIGVDDNFFTLGGDSITAMRLLNLCRKGNMSLTMPELLTYNTVSLFCEKTRAVTPPTEALSHKRRCASVPVPNGRIDSETCDAPSLWLTHNQWEKIHALLGLQTVGSIENVYACSDAHSGVLDVYTSNYRGTLTFAVESKDALSPAQVVSAWNQVAQRHTTLRTVILRHPGSRQHYIHVLLRKASPTVLVLPPTVDVVRDMKSLAPSSWETSPPHRLVVGQDLVGNVLIKLEAGCALIDAMSVPILLEDLGLALRGRLPIDPGTPYSHYVSYLQSQPQEETHQYWKRALAGARPCKLARRPSAELDSLVTTPEPRSLRCLLPEDLDRFNSFWQTHRLTVANIFQLAWGLVLQHYTGSGDVCFGTIVSGRDIPLPQIWQMVGPFFNILPCRITLDSPRRVMDVLRENQISLQRRNEHQHCSIPDVIRQAGLDVQGEQQLFNTVLTVQPSFITTQISGISFKLIELEDATEVSPLRHFLFCNAPVI
jgi:brevianamide F synthase